MWELITSMLGSMVTDDAKKDMAGSGMNMTQSQSPSAPAPGQQTEYAQNGSNADEGLAANTPTAKQPMTAGDIAGNVATGLLSPYTKGLDSIKSLYNDPTNKQAIGGVLNMLSPAKEPGQSMTIPATSNMPSMTTGNLGLPQMGGPIGFASGNNPELKRGTLANQAYGRYY